MLLLILDLGYCRGRESDSSHADDSAWSGDDVSDSGSSDSSESSAADSGSSSDFSERLPARSRVVKSPPAKRKRVFKPKTQKELKTAVNKCVEPPEPILIVERAKSGRSKCRACMEPIPQGAARVGMRSFIGGRVTVAWQTPDCFMKGISFSVALNSRGKCKYSGATFKKGQAKLTMTSHTTKVNILLKHACTVLAPVIDILADPDCDAEIDVEILPGFKDIAKFDQEVVKKCFKKISLSEKAKQEVDFVAEVPPRDPFENIPEEKMVDLADNDESSQGTKESEMSWNGHQNGPQATPVKSELYNPPDHPGGETNTENQGQQDNHPAGETPTDTHPGGEPQSENEAEWGNDPGEATNTLDEGSWEEYPWDGSQIDLRPGDEGYEGEEEETTTKPGLWPRQPPLEPDQDDENCLKLRVRFPSGMNILRRFRTTETVDCLFAYVAQVLKMDPEHDTSTIESFDVLVPYPKKSLLPWVEKTFEEAALANAQVTVRIKNTYVPV